MSCMRYHIFLYVVAKLDQPLSLVASELTAALLQNCQIDRKTLSICISLIERGVNPEALAVRLPFPSHVVENNTPATPPPGR